MSSLALGSAPMGTAALENLEALPLLRHGVSLVGTDSHDVTGDNDDGFEARYSFLYRDGAEWVLFDEEGPGCLYVLRTICHKGTVRVYLDGAKTATFAWPAQDIYSGDTPPFVKPFVGDEETAHGSSWSYVPIPYARGCKVTIDEMEKPHFYNIFAHKYPADTAVKTFDGAADLSRAAKWWSNPAQPPEPSVPLRHERGSLRAEPGKAAVLADLEGAGAIVRLRIRFAEGAFDPAARLTLRAYWEKNPVPAIDAPLSSFFALGCPRALDALAHADPAWQHTERYVAGVVKPRSLYVGQSTDGWFYCNFPMPFWKSARIEIVNRSHDEAVEFAYEVDHHDKPYPDAAGYFFAMHREETPLRHRQDYCILDITGRGHYVGCVVTMSSVHRDSPYNTELFRGYLEGDARFYVDGNRTPFVASTGTEEYFNWGWYDLLKHDGVFAYPTHGYPLHVGGPVDHSVMYRFHAGEVVPFHRAFRFDLEHGPAGNVPGHYSSTAFYYLRPEPSLLLTDELDLGDAASEKAHDYSCAGNTRKERRIAPYEGAYQLPATAGEPRDRDHVVKDTGRSWSGHCDFTVKLDPQNQGARLVRRSYYAFGAKGDLGPARPDPVLIPAQRVEVLVDGARVGEWYAPAGHARDAWRDTQFEIPASVTQGKERIAVTLRAKDGLRWDEYTYWAYSYVNPD